MPLDVTKLSIMPQYDRGPEILTNRFKDDREALAMSDEYFSQDAREILKYSFEKQWFINIAFLMGYQNLTWTDWAGSLREPRTPSYRMRIITNKILPLVLRHIAIMTQTKLNWRVAPNSSDKDDISAARVGDTILEHDEHELDLDEIRLEAEYWAACAGTTFLKLTFDPEAGPAERIWIHPQTKLPIPEDDAKAIPGLKAQMEELESYVEVRQGSPVLEMVNPFRMYVDPWAANWREMRWCMEVTDKPMSYFYQRYGKEKADQIRPGQREAHLNYFERRLLNMNGVFGIAGSIQLREPEDAVEERVLFRAPYEDGKAKFKNGRMIVVAGNKVVLNEENPYFKIGYGKLNRHGFPYEPFFHSRVPGRFWGTSLVEHLISNQRLYNYVRSKIAEGFRMMGSKKWIAPRDLNLGNRNLTSGIEVLEFDAMNANGILPQQVQPVGPAPEYMELLQRTDNDMQMLTAQPEAVQGEAPGSVRSGVGVQALQERAMLMNHPLIRQRELSWGRIGSMDLMLRGRYTTEPMLVKIFGADRAIQVRKFIGADLRDNYDVRVPKGSQVPVGKAELNELAIRWTESGILNPQNPAHQQAIIRMTRFSEGEEWFREMEADRYVARRENDQMTDRVQPAFPPVNVFDNDEIHIYEHNLIRKSDIYVNLHPLVRMGFDAHCAKHEERQAQRQQAMMEQQEAAKGGPGPKGAPASPSRGSLQNVKGMAT